MQAIGQQFNPVNLHQLKEIKMNNNKIIATLPFGRLIKLIIDLLTFAKDGYSKEEGQLLLKDLSEIASSIADKIK